MKKKELKSMPVDELKKQLENIEKEMLALSAQDEVKIKKLKRMRARIITFIHGKEFEKGGYAS
ncbi:MAG: hypothetical protein QXS91_03910 [Candidatus Anstonellales archaeon]